MVRRKRIRELVAQLLAKYKVREAPVPVEKIAEKEGVFVLRRKLSEDDMNFSGLLLREAGRVLIVVNERDAPSRQRFTIAHELGHYFLGHGSLLHVDHSVFPAMVMFRDHRAGAGVDENEIEANAFAAELLMPQAFLEQDILEADVRNIEDLIEKLASDYEVSVQAMTIRLTNLGYLGT